MKLENSCRLKKKMIVVNLFRKLQNRYLSARSPTPAHSGSNGLAKKRNSFKTILKRNKKEQKLNEF